MKKLFMLCSFLLVSAFGQAQILSTNATVTDTDGQAWIGGTYSIVPAQSGYYYNGTPLSMIPITGTLNNTGSFNGVSLYTTTTLTPVTAQYTFTICSKTSAPCSVFNSPVTTASLTSLIDGNIRAPRFSTAANSYGYSDVEISNIPPIGGYYFNVINNVQRVWNGTSWQSGGTTSNFITYASHTFYVLSGIVYAKNNTTGLIDFSGSDAAVVINETLALDQPTCGTEYFKDGIYPINSLTSTTDGRTLSYAIGIPNGTGVSQHQCEWHFEGESMTNAGGWENSNTIQTNGVIFNVTPAAVASVVSDAMIAGIWQIPSDDAANPGNQDFFKNLTVRFPSNQRGNEVNIYPLFADTISYENVLTDFNIPYCSLAAPVAGSRGSAGMTSTQSSQGNYQRFENTGAVGSSVGYVLGSEHILGGTMTAAFTNTAAWYGNGFDGNYTNIYHPSYIANFVDQESINGFHIGGVVQSGALMSFGSMDIEFVSSSHPITACPAAANFVRVTNLSEYPGGNASGMVPYTTIEAEVGIVDTPPSQIWATGGSQFQTYDSSGNFGPSLVSPARSTLSNPATIGIAPLTATGQASLFAIAGTASGAYSSYGGATQYFGFHENVFQGGQDGTNLPPVIPGTSGAHNSRFIQSNSSQIGITSENVAGGTGDFFEAWNGLATSGGTLVYKLDSNGVPHATLYATAILYKASGTALPTCTSGFQGFTAVVSDATLPTYMGSYVSGGAITTSVICSYNGTTYSWLTH